MREVAALIAEILRDVHNETIIAGVKRRVDALTERFPLYSWKLQPAHA
jgi:glycine/serine hydroxymethyltransferase